MGRSAAVSAKDAMAAQLNELMGKERDVPVDQRENRVVKFDDEDVDKFWLCGLSPHEVLKHTRSDLGAHDKIQDEGAKTEWEALPQEKKDEYGYEHELLRFLEQLANGLDAGIRRNKERVSSENAARKVTLSKDTQMQVDAIAKEIAELQSRAETLGAEGNLDESMAAMKSAELLVAKKDALENPAAFAVAASKEKTMEVCDICGNFMSEGDKEAKNEAAQARLDEHFNGRQHRAWDQIRKKLAELRAMNDGKGPNRKGAAGSDADRDRGRDRDSHRGGYESRGGYDRGGGGGGGYRGGYDRDRERDRDRDRGYRGYSDRDRERDTYRERRQRSRSPDRRSGASYRDYRSDRSRDRY